MTRDKADANKTALVALWVSAGGLWYDQRREAGFDGLAIFRGRCFPVEIKDGRKPPSAQALTPNERKQAQRITDQHVEYTIWRGVDDVVAALQAEAV